MEELAIYGADELADKAGVSRRTVRYYVQRGLLPAPKGLGRGKHYSESHLTQLLRIRELQESGVPLEQIADKLAGREPPSTPRTVQQTVWTRVVLGEGLELHVRGRRLSADQLQRIGDIVAETTGEEEP